MKVTLAFWIVAAIAANASIADQDKSAVAVEKALPYLESEGTWWIEEKKCASCHHSTIFFVWAKDLALRSGFDVDRDVFSEQRKWVLESLLEPIAPDTEKPEEKVDHGTLVGDRNVEGVSQLLVSRAYADLPDRTLDRLKDIVLRNRSEDGNWKPGGQLPKQMRPAEETQLVSNQWALLALGIADFEKARPAEPAVTSEWYAMNVLVNADDSSVEELLGRQNEDGGWNWIDGEPSSPTGTGQALFALARKGVTGKYSEELARARHYLVSTQNDDGSWTTKSTKNRDRSARISNFWGTAWAVIGLLESNTNRPENPAGGE